MTSPGHKTARFVHIPSQVAPLPWMVDSFAVGAAAGAGLAGDDLAHLGAPSWVSIPLMAGIINLPNTP